MVRDDESSQMGKLLDRAFKHIAESEARARLPAPQLIAQRILLTQLTLFYFRLANGTRVFDVASRELVELRDGCLDMIDANMNLSSLDVEEAVKFRAAVAEDLEEFFALIENAIKQMDFAKAQIRGKA